MAAQHSTDPGPAPLLFGFRGIRALQVLVSLAALVMALAGILMLNSYVDSNAPLELTLAVFFGIVFLFLFGVTLRLPTSFVAISPERMRIRYGGFVDTIIDTRDVTGASLVKWGWWQGLGVRTFFGGDVALVATWGVAAELQLKTPIRVWLIPKLWRVKATRVTLGVRNPHKMVERFGPVKPGTAPAAAKQAKRKRR